MTTLKETLTLITSRYRGALYFKIREELRKQLKQKPKDIQVLDVGGRNSPYTCCMPGQYTISDLKRESSLQMQLKLGFTDNIIENLKHNRSNLKDVVFDDMTKTKFMPNSFDEVIAIEVIEHIVEDEIFIRNIYSVLKPGGFLILTTPNGYAIPKNNPDHVRHYHIDDLKSKLSKVFDWVVIDYIVPMTRAHAKSLSPWSIKRPCKTIRTMINGYINFLQQKVYVLNKSNSVHLLAVAKKY